MRRFSSTNLQPCPDITWGKGWSEERPSCWGSMEIRPLFGILSIQSSITTTAGVWARSIYTQQQPEQEGDNSQQAGAFPPPGAQWMMLGGPSPAQGCQAGPSPRHREFQELLCSGVAFTMCLEGFCEHCVASLGETLPTWLIL